MTMQQTATSNSSDMQMKEGDDWVCPNCGCEIRLRHHGDPGYVQAYDPRCGGRARRQSGAVERGRLREIALRGSGRKFGLGCQRAGSESQPPPPVRVGSYFAAANLGRTGFELAIAMPVFGRAMASNVVTEISDRDAR